MFELSRVNAKLCSFNPRTELHGTEGHLAGDLKFEANMSPDVLAHFDPTLRHFLFTKRDGVVQDLANQGSDAPNLRFPQMALPLDWSTELVGADLTIHFGASGKGDIELTGVKVNSFKLTPKEGGTVVVGFRVQASPDEKTAGKLCSLIQASHDITLTPPAAEEIKQAA